MLDEPVQGVDNSGEEAMYNLIETIAKSRLRSPSNFTRSSLCDVSNDPCYLPERPYLLRDPRAVSTSSEFRTLYGSKISANLAIYEHMHDHTHGTDGSIEKLKEMVENSNDNKEIPECLTIFCSGLPRRRRCRHCDRSTGCFVVCRLAYFGDTLSTQHFWGSRSRFFWKSI